MQPLIFDGHNDALTRLWLSDAADPVAAFLNGGLATEMDLPRCQQAHFLGGMFAVFIPPFAYVKQHHPNKIVDLNATEFSRAEMQQIVQQQIALLHDLVARSQQQLQLCTTVDQIKNCQNNKQIAIVMHMEGAEALDANLFLLDDWYAAGLRSIGALWNRTSLFGHGLNASFPHSPNTGEGLTRLGKQLITKAAQLNMVVDVSHMNEAAFWDSAEILAQCDQPVVATHSNAHALCPQARNLTDSQLAAIAASQGMVGVNFDTAFLRADGQRNKYTSIDVLLDHIEYLMQKLGETRVGFGSDFDGGCLSDEIGDVTGLQKIVSKMQQRGYTNRLIEQICKDNWFNVLARIWKK
ncbi:dipeptidase [Acinetobacter sp. MD2(2019)]|uniref:dipeptidase n=1 Tax=Acinetobacter sp. MD2(2019) TaxID=2605273 RepID=UPI002D1E8824|nr:dipeptidase [Acinetobacter sp. MD2(2019)]MEB3754363.1 dipeptidase [Acinetobacter sp. MD2(2019)]